MSSEQMEQSSNIVLLEYIAPIPRKGTIKETSHTPFRRRSAFPVSGIVARATNAMITKMEAENVALAVTKARAMSASVTHCPVVNADP